MKKSNENNLEVFDLLPKSIQKTKELTIKRKNVLAQLIFLDNGMSDFKNSNNGWFFRDNKTLAKECSITEANLLPCLAKLQQMGFIQRKSGSSTSRKASYYKICWDNINAFGTNNSSSNSSKTIVVNNSSSTQTIAVNNSSNNSSSNDKTIAVNNSSSTQTIAVQEVSVDRILAFERRLDRIENLLLLILNNSSNNSSSNNSSNNSIDIEIEKDLDIKIEKDLDIKINIKNNLEENTREFFFNKEEQVEKSVEDTDFSDDSINDTKNITGAVDDTAPYEEDLKYNTDSNVGLESDMTPSKNNSLEQSPSKELKLGKSMNAITKSNIYKLQQRLKASTTIEELENKRIKFKEWVGKELDKDHMTQNEYLSTIKLVEETYQKTLNRLQYENISPSEEDESKLDELASSFFSNSSSNDNTKEQSTATPAIKSKEQILADLEDFKSSLGTYTNPQDALYYIKMYANKWDKEIVKYDLLQVYQDLVNYINNGGETKPSVSRDVEVKEQLEYFKQNIKNYSCQKEAKADFNQLVSDLDSDIIKYKLGDVVKEIYETINAWDEQDTETPSVSQNKPLEETLVPQDDKVVTSEPKLQETTLKQSAVVSAVEESLVSQNKPLEETFTPQDDEVVSEYPKPQETALKQLDKKSKINLLECDENGISLGSKVLAKSIYYKKPLEEVMAELVATRSERGTYLVDDNEAYPF